MKLSLDTTPKSHNVASSTNLVSPKKETGSIEELEDKIQTKIYGVLDATAVIMSIQVRELVGKSLFSFVSFFEKSFSQSLEDQWNEAYFGSLWQVFF